MMQNYLIHHGTKGQKWGIRRYQNEDGSYTAQGKGRYDGSSTGVSSIRAKKRSIRELSDQEVVTSINRLRNEKTLKRELKAVNHPARTAVGDVMKSIGKKTATDVGSRLATSAVEYLVGKATTKAFGKSSHDSVKAFGKYISDAMTKNKKNDDDNKDNNKKDKKDKKD